MFKPFKEIEKTESQTTYVFHAIYIWLLYALIAAGLIGYFTEVKPALYTGVVGILLYFLVVTTQYIPLNRKIKAAAHSGSVEISGSKWSFSNPLTIKIPNAQD